MEAACEKKVSTRRLHLPGNKFSRNCHAPCQETEVSPEGASSIIVGSRLSRKTLSSQLSPDDKLFLNVIALVRIVSQCP